jgi:hypothetical protein
MMSPPKKLSTFAIKDREAGGQYKGIAPKTIQNTKKTAVFQAMEDGLRASIRSVDGLP